MWRVVVWAGFVLAMGLTGWGLWRMEIQPVWKAYLGVCWLYLISNVFTLAKMLRDAHEAEELREYTEREHAGPADTFGSLADKLRGALKPRDQEPGR